VDMVITFTTSKNFLKKILKKNFVVYIVQDRWLLGIPVLV